MAESTPGKGRRKAGKKVAGSPPQAAATAAPTRVAVTAAAKSRPDLATVRGQIDGIDREIQALIAERALFARQVGRAKGKLAAAVEYYRPEREAQVLRRVVDRNDGPLADEVLVRLFREIMSACLAQQEPLKIGYLGPEGTFSQQAVHKHFGHSARGLPLASVEEVFDEVAAGAADFGVVPVENSGQGTIQSTLDLFPTSPLKICGEVELRVHQYLLSRTGRMEDVERIYSHGLSLAQCRNWLRQHLPGVEAHAVSSNAEGARRARNADDAAAIAGDSAGHVYGLKAIAGPIEDRSDNTTRFLVIGRASFPPSGNDRTSLLVSIRDQPGALYQVLEPLARHGISMNRIESRPEHGALWQYAFFIDVGGHVDESPLKDALAEVDAFAGDVRVLGSYPVAVP
ncbi:MULTISPECIES: prephenate dehydratase [unclassified Luteimonas]|uniref:prephenate dehydratase n=1 Tax=unclassified Luteimonas TaxID=2629088 RepID=UPI0016010FC9|nr:MULTISPECIES: prephenate dehydratase [unclassified Luteimonas]MBB1472063.1 prephenate dehydratase [Luteimonas sp. MC1782]MBB6599212.1 prephenate dehydratase [Luteimonas sp. MC1825]QOC89330.1 prephenate dehydratase [Luteimonas sp. MC1825]